MILGLALQGLGGLTMLVGAGNALLILGRVLQGGSGPRGDVLATSAASFGLTVSWELFLLGLIAVGVGSALARLAESRGTRAASPTP